MAQARRSLNGQRDNNSSSRTRRRTINFAKTKAAAAAKLSIGLLVMLLILDPSATRTSKDLLANCAVLPATNSQQNKQQNGDSMQEASSANSIEFPPQLPVAAASTVDGGFGRSWFFGPPAAANTKRARKMSAFMPMRGRRAGPQGDAPSDWAWPDRENDDGQFGSILHLARQHWPNPNANLQQQQQALVGIPNRFALQHLEHQRQRLLGDQQQSPDEGEDQLMEAKPRRAFHPMRGKKSPAEWFQFYAGNQPAAPTDQYDNWSVESGGEN